MVFEYRHIDQFEIGIVLPSVPDALAQFYSVATRSRKTGIRNILKNSVPICLMILFPYKDSFNGI